MSILSLDSIPPPKFWVSGTAHVNTLESFWGLLKRGISGVYHSVSAKHLQPYVNEYVFRYNHRRGDAPMLGIIESQVRHVRQGRCGKYAPIDQATTGLHVVDYRA